MLSVIMANLRVPLKRKGKEDQRTLAGQTSFILLINCPINPMIQIPTREFIQSMRSCNNQLVGSLTRPKNMHVISTKHPKLENNK